MKSHFKYLVVGILILSACRPKHRESELPDNVDVTVSETKKAVAETNIDFPQPIDSSGTIIYPLLPIHAEEDDESSFFHKSKVERSAYWNLIFYNAGTKKYHLLDSARKMIISSYTTEYINSKFSLPNEELEQMIKTGKLPEFAEKQNSGVIIYDVTTDDLNKNGKLDDPDPSYLFVSDRNGYNFRQISPTRLNVTGWKMIEKFGIVLIETGNRNKTTQYVYDLKKNAPATEVFDKGFIEKIDRLYKKQFPRKQEK